MKITVWDTIFLLLTIIPVSRMFSTIFMKFVVRVGTVNEERWAGRATMGLGGLLMLGRFAGRGFMSGAHAGVSSGPSGGNPGASGSTRPHPGGGPSGGPPLASPDGISPVGAASNTPPSPTKRVNRTGPGTPTGHSQAAGPVSVVDGEVPAGYSVRRTASGLYVASRTNRGSESAHADSAGSGGGDFGAIHQGRQSVLDRMMDEHREAAGKAARVGAVVGDGIGVMTGEPLAAGMTAAVVAMSGRAMGSTAHTVSRLTGGMYREMKGGRSFTAAAQAVTGESRGHVAVAKLVTATAAAPLGHAVQRQAVRGAGWAADRLKPGRTIAERPDYR